MKAGNSIGGRASSRRGFLKTSVASASGAALAGMALNRRLFAAGSDAIKIGLIGCGGRGTGTAVNAMSVDPGVRLVALCDLFADRVRARRKALKAARPEQVAVDDAHCFVGFDGYKGVIESADAVLIANAGKFHPLHTKAAIEAGRHVFVEKPHAIDPAGLKQVAAACELARKKGLSIVSGLQSRFVAGYQETVKRIHDGAIGEIVAIEESILQAPYGLVRRKPGIGEVQYQVANQKGFTWIGGGEVCQTLSHNLDRSLWVMKEQAPAKCHGLAGRSSSFEASHGDVFDHHAIVYELAGGVKLYAFCRAAMGCYNKRSTLILGTRGRAKLIRCRIDGETKWRYRGRRVNPYDEEQRALFAAIRRAKPINSGYHLVNSTLATLMGQLACYTGTEITRDQVLQSDFYYPPKPEACRFDMPPPIKLGPDGLYPLRVPGKTRLL